MAATITRNSRRAVSVHGTNAMYMRGCRDGCPGYPDDPELTCKEAHRLAHYETQKRKREREKALIPKWDEVSHKGKTQVKRSTGLGSDGKVSVKSSGYTIK